jgi:transcriptional regulator with PAS, ATPase and Fis domain
MVGVNGRDRWMNGAPAPHAGQRSETAPGEWRGDFHGLVGRSAAMQRVYAQVTRVSAGDAPVLIVGETGTGKELIARAIHAASPRRNGPFLAVNCAALPRDLIESELFGYRRGAFTGAVAEHPGLIRAAASGTVLLDEVTEMSPELQAKLLRVLQEHTVRPVGSVEEVAVDVRFIASTNRHLHQALRDGLLRPDLYYRLAVSVVAVPALRDREDDLALLVEHYLGVLHQRYRDVTTSPRGMGVDALYALTRHAWPGNVRELFNVLEHAFTVSAAPCIRHADLAELVPPAPLPLPIALTPAAAVSTYADSERALIQHTLARAGGNKTRAAQQLGISRKKLYARIAKYAL